MKKITTSQYRIKELIEALNMNLTEFSERTGVQKSALSNYLHGTREPRQDKISQMADPFGIDPAWLMGYDAPMRKPVSKPPVESQEFLDLYTNATPEIQAAVLTLLKSVKPKP